MKLSCRRICWSINTSFLPGNIIIITKIIVDNMAKVFTFLSVRQCMVTDSNRVNTEYCSCPEACYPYPFSKIGWHCKFCQTYCHTRHNNQRVFSINEKIQRSLAYIICIWCLL